MPAKIALLSDEDYRELASFRYELRCFLEFSESAAAAEHLTPQQHQALLVIRATPRDEATIRHLSERLRIKHHSAVELAQRLEAASLIQRRPSPSDARAVILTLTRKGAKKLETLTLAHRAELSRISPAILQLLRSISP
jgi:DNA-binding MarR family transcriptional regulator